ncbi:MAG: DUF1127 domain-containing protein [bacterium]
MTNLFTTLRTNIAKRAMYRRTRNELAGLSMAMAEDIGIHPADAEAVARRAVWG